MCDDPFFRKEWGCDDDSKEWVYDLGGTAIKRCPNSLVKMAIIRESWIAYAFYKRGILPDSRGLRHQTKFYISVMSRLEQLESESEGWYMDRREKKNDG